jgi:hypothetical protein
VATLAQQTAPRQTEQSEAIKRGAKQRDTTTVWSFHMVRRIV